ncbi:CatB-related O-acetyltransferase [Tamlana sp. 2_MG-2023]|uniref:CatB-related O-acetyltransferase n=1 Tax=unclassified Tamlana TaxID=2614803 RepID=UPI0026E2E4EF|nr:MULTISPECIES: CatB-related O-acetyltransferase [unclassified Tamlana]MDO6759420.1 CatB-related O-acetyltransferase [Tamlana sp. 2_MG-2023]MDO6790441.1 CatB-related O-acetyltransferase [Tamlana sp. 1_MG-2023]
MKHKIRIILWRLLGIDYNQALNIHDFIFLKNDKHSKIGNKTYDNGALVWRWTNSELIIGNYCSIANNVRFIIDEGYHTASTITNFPLINNLFKNELLDKKNKLHSVLQDVKQKKGIYVGNDVWIGMGSYIMPGVKIGNGVTIGANSVVTKNVPDYAVVAGSPAKLIKYKYSKSQIDSLNKISWWNWEETTIKERINDFYSDENAFIEKYKVN